MKHQTSLNRFNTNDEIVSREFKIAAFSGIGAVNAGLWFGVSEVANKFIDNEIFDHIANTSSDVSLTSVVAFTGLSTVYAIKNAIK